MARASSVKQREEISRRTGIRKHSPFEPLFHAYGFDVFKSSPVDVMHFMGNLVKYVVGQQYDIDCLDQRLYELKLKLFPWLHYHKSRHRRPRKAVKYTSWKTNECQLFAFPCGENVVDGLLTEDNYHIFYQLARVVEVLYHHETRGCGGWTPDHIDLIERLLFVLASMLEKRYGLTACRPNLHIGVCHLAECIRYLGGIASWWCYSFERLVKSYMARTTNEKHIELTYARCQARLDAIASFYRRYGFEEEVEYIVSPFSSDPGHVVATVEGVELLMEKLVYELERWKENDRERYLVATALFHRRYAIGSVSSSPYVPSANDLEAVVFDLTHRHGVANPLEGRLRCMNFKKGVFVPTVGWNGWRFRVGEPAIIKGITNVNEAVSGTFNTEYVCNIKAVMVAVHDDDTVSVFFRASFFDDVGGGRCNPWNGQLLVKPADRVCMSDDYYPYRILPASFLLRPVILVPLPKNNETAQWTSEEPDTEVFCVNDFMRPLNAEKFTSLATNVPPYPSVVNGAVRLVPPQIACQVDGNWGYRTWGVITHFNADSSTISVKMLSSVGGRGSFQGTIMMRNGQEIVDKWDLSDVQKIVAGSSHSRRFTWFD